MTLTGGIIAILAALIPFGIWLYKSNQAKHVDPVEQNRERYQQIDADIAARDSLAASAHAAADLDELERLQNRKGAGDTSRQNGNVSQS